MARDYKHEYATYQGKPEQIKNRAKRNAARAEMEKSVGKAALAGRDVGHKKSLDSGGSNNRGNLKVQSQKSNRGWRKGKSGYTVD